jgi:hypothetical protein
MNIDETIARAFVQGDITDTAFRAYLLSRRLNDRLEWTLGDGVCSGRLDWTRTKRSRRSASTGRKLTSASSETPKSKTINKKNAPPAKRLNGAYRS